MNEIPTVEAFTLQFTKKHGMYDGWMKDLMIEFTKAHVKAQAKEFAFIVKAKWESGESGYLTKEDFELAYPENLIK